MTTLESFIVAAYLAALGSLIVLVVGLILVVLRLIF